ncbi:receptor-type tyrosine-protein phosphatase H [Danio aesculapii]|uniref:receptor-type tyrosine-protein phosphatase H n=1 Tax=Danio aesculapii TaxID=1142201 RepID=UPI0024C0E022|nr:receptor-type tyrosine-protein phosphatase H [Danio aesculapii]
MEQVLAFALLCVLSVSGLTKPPDVENVKISHRTETELTFEWDKVNGNSSYNYTLKRDGIEGDETITVSDTDMQVTHTVIGLSPGTAYSFKLFTVFEDQTSEGFQFSAETVPSNVESVSVIEQNENMIKLKWNKGKDKYTYELNYGDKVDEIKPQSNEVEHTVKSLSPGTEYNFTLYTVLGSLKSSGHNFTTVTAPSDIQNDSFQVIDRSDSALTLQWTKDKEEYSYELHYRDVLKPISSTDFTVVYVVTPLTAGTEYFFTLYTVFKEVKSHGFRRSLVTVPSNVENVSVVEVNDTDVILQWNAVPNELNNKYDYVLKYGDVEEFLEKTNGNMIELNVSGLIPATNYSFTLHTEFYSQRSTGFNFYLSTSLSSITEVRVTRSLTELTVEWNKLNRNNVYNYTLLRSDGAEADNNFTGSAVVGDVITHKYSSLKPGTVYSFTLFTVSNNVRDTGYGFKSITTLDCATFNWEVTNTSIFADVYGCTYVTAQNSSGSGKNGSIEADKVNLRDLYPGESYTVSLFYNLESKMLTQCSQRLTLVPYVVSNLKCEYHSGGYGLAVKWVYPDGIVDVVGVDVNGKSFNHSHGSDEPTQQLVTGLQAAQWYKVTATSFSGARRSETIWITCQTDPAGVIAGVMVFFLLVIIICAGLFVWFRYKSAKRNNGPDAPAVLKVPKKNYKTITCDKFPEHFRNMSRDDNRAFSAEYEDLGSVGVEQSKVAALLPENKDKNRFSNVLPYDTSRVHLTINKAGDSDYINANYMPGYGNATREYIAAQGPLPSTVNDFWRMVWEKKSSTIVMVTNCTEGGRVKCEQYWPLDYTPCLYENLLVTVKSENKSQSWTLREFNVKNKMTSETRTVRHFHFTAWPDHGVPRGTEELIQFREIIRQHIESHFSTGPTVVHCSAGVGRTGTLIALDVLLQQLNREKAVGVAAFVQEMRLNRPLMVQTESQYVFLHQCILDSLQPKFAPQSEPIYQNTDTIYVNAMALKEFENSSNT